MSKVSNTLVVVCAIAVSYCIVSISGSVAEVSARETRIDQLVHSTDRIAVAFEVYNQKRFAY